MRFRKTFTALLGFDRRERRGTYILSVILVALLVVRVTAFRPGNIPPELPPLPAMTDEAAAGEEGGMPARLTVFDPNTTGFDDLVSLGLTERQARTLINYRTSGARFRRPEDIMRVYGIDSATAAVLIPYIRIEKQADSSGKPKAMGGYRGINGEGDAAGYPLRGKDRHGLPEGRFASSSVIEDSKSGSGNDGDNKIIDLNMCTAGELEALRGIGPVLASRIIRYRRLLGGFVDKSQLTEVYGLDSAVTADAALRLTLTYDSVRALVLDSVTFDELVRHPYLGYEAARNITRYRSLAAGPVTLGDMVGDGVITAIQAERIAPYVRPPQGVAGSDFEFISSKVLK
jgi:DNA uptake protein ComE-like DNA-binding protein